MCPNLSVQPGVILYTIKITQMIHVSKIHTLVETIKEFSIKWISEQGEVISCDRCIFTSFHGKGSTFNIMLPSREVRTVNRYTLLEFNGEEVVL